jgi:excisionase family DNA binding protein
MSEHGRFVTRGRDRLFIPDQLLMPWHPGNTIATSLVARKLHCSESTVRRLIEAGDLEGYKLRSDKANSPYRINVESLHKFVHEMHEKAGIEPKFNL